MASEEFLIIGIQDEKASLGSVKIEELKSLVCDHIQIDPYWEPLRDALTDLGVGSEEKLKINLRTIFDAFNSVKFMRAIPGYMNKRITKYNIKLLRAGLIAYSKGYLTMKQIGDAASVHQMKEFETLSMGIPCNEETIMSTLWIVGRTIATSVLNKWIDIHENYLEVRDMLMVHEFIYLMCNTKDRNETLQKIPKLGMNPRMNKDIQLFQVDQEFHKTYKSPDYKMQHMLNSWYNMDKANYEGVSKVKLHPDKHTGRHKGKVAVKLEAETPTDDNTLFKKQLRSLLVTVEIKNRIRTANLKISKMKINGKMAYDELTSNLPAQLVSTLPVAFGTREVPEEVARVETKKNEPLVIKKRPQTASRPLAETSSLKIIKTRPESSKPANPVRLTGPASHTNSRIQTAHSRMPTSPSVISSDNINRKASMFNLNAKKSGFNFNNPERLHTASSMNTRSDRKYLDNTNYTSSHSRFDTLTTFEDVFDQEFLAYEESNKPRSTKQSVYIADDYGIKKNRMFSAYSNKV